jgi:hypothetical protein
MNCRLKVKRHPKFMGDQLGLIDMTAAAAADIHFLEAHNVRLAGCDDADNAPGRQLPVKPKAPVNIVGQNSGQVSNRISVRGMAREYLFGPIHGLMRRFLGTR